MAELKKYRTLLGLTQAELASKLKTTQQTVARWESGKTEIPVVHLKELAVMFGCSIDKLLGLSSEDRAELNIGRAEVDHGLPFGTAKVSLAFAQREYPIDENTYESIIGALDGFIGPGDSDRNRWLEFATLNNKLVLLNLKHLKSIDLVSDDVVEMPAFEHPELYYAIDVDGEDVGDELAQRIADFTDGLSDDDLYNITSRINITYIDGSESNMFLEEAGAAGVYDLSTSLVNVPTNTFIVIHGEGAYVKNLINLSHVAAIEVPLERYLRLIQDDDI